MELRPFIRNIPNYPKEGILFFDITPLLADSGAFHTAIDALVERFRDCGASKVLAAEARGFIFGAPLAYALGIGFVPVRKQGKLPYKTCSVTYNLEYGTDTLCMHEDAVAPGESVLIVDDLLASGGTCAGMLQLVVNVGAKVAGIGVLIELGFLNGRAKIEGHPYQYIIQL